MNLKLLHFYPDLMSLYGSYANLLVLKRRLEELGNSVTVEAVVPGQEADIEHADFLLMGAGTERAQKAVLADFIRFGEAVKTAAENGMSMLFCGTAMELLGKVITDVDGTSYEGIGLGSFSTTQKKSRIAQDVYGHTTLFSDPVVGFINKSSIVHGVETPLLTHLSLGFGNEASLTAEGFLHKNVIGSELTGPLLVKNPPLVDTIVTGIYQQHGEPVPNFPKNLWAEQSYAITVKELRQRFEAK